MRLATASVGLVSPRSTWLSIGALTPERSARSRSERSIASRRARTRGPMWMAVSSSTATIQTYAIAYSGARRRPRNLRRVAGFVAPDVLVLAGGGVVGEAWMTGVLAGIEDEAGVALRDVEAFVGTSAGADRRRAPGRGRSRCAGRRGAPARRRRTAEADGGSGLLRTAARWGWAATSPLAPVATAITAPGGALVRSAMLAARARHRPHPRPAARRGRALRRALRRAPARLLRRQALGQARRLRRAGRARAPAWPTR